MIGCPTFFSDGDWLSVESSRKPTHLEDMSPHSDKTVCSFRDGLRIFVQQCLHTSYDFHSLIMGRVGRRSVPFDLKFWAGFEESEAGP